MERNNRLLFWILLSTAIFFFYSSFRQRQDNSAKEAAKKQEEMRLAQEKRSADSRQLALKILSENPNISLYREPARQRFTLGTMDAKDGYPFVVTLDNQGATIERIELVTQSKPGRFDYRSLQSKNIIGYLGYLAHDEFAGKGLLVNSVPGGSAAALAVCREDASIVGLQPGDWIVGWEGLSGTASNYELHKLMHRLTPGHKLELKVIRPTPKKADADILAPIVAAEVKPAKQLDAPKQEEPKNDSSEAVAEAKSVEPQDANSKKPESIADEGAVPQGTPLTFVATLTEQPVAVLRAEDDFEAEQVKGNNPVGSCGTTLALLDEKQIEEGDSFIYGLEKTLRGRWTAKKLETPQGMAVEFSMPIGSHLKLMGIDANLELVKQYRLLPTTQSEGGKPELHRHLELTTILRNLDDVKHKVSLRQEGLNGISLEGWWYPTKLSPHFFSSPGARDVIIGDRFAKNSILMTRKIVENAQKFPADPDMMLFGPQDSEAKRDVNYIGLDTQVFAAAMLPAADTPDSMRDLNKARARVLNNSFQDPKQFDSYRQQAYNTGFWFETSARDLAPKGEWKQSYRIFAGPKDPQLLSAYQLDGAIEYGWHIFGFFAVRLGWILHAFYFITSNYGIAIMMLTVLVRSCMFPVSRKMAINAQKMQVVQPELAKLREALKDEPTKMMQAQQMLFKKAGINQLAGCLPAMIQLPIVIGLYRCVSVDVALRQQALIPGLEWCSNLAGPDMFMDWSQWMPEFIAGRGTGWFGPYLNILPIITITLFIIQQKVLMPKATDEQTRMAQQIMMMMTIMMGVLFFKVPAGLCIYFITSSTWSLVERFLIKKYTPQAHAKPLPENTAAEIVSILSKGPQAVQRAASNNDPDKPKMKAPKNPETLTELWEMWFGKKDAAASAASSKNESTQSNANKPRSDRNYPKRDRPKKPKK